MLSVERSRSDVQENAEHTFFNPTMVFLSALLAQMQTSSSQVTAAGFDLHIGFPLCSPARFLFGD